MKRAVQISLWFALLLVFAGNSFAILRPRFPHRPMPPSHGHIVIVDEDSLPRTNASKPTDAAK